MGTAASRDTTDKRAWPAARIDPAQMRLLRDLCHQLNAPVKDNDADMVRYAVSVFNLLGRISLFTHLLSGPDGEPPAAADLEDLTKRLGLSGR